MPKPPPPTFYPAYCFPLSPTHNTWAKLTAADVHELQERSGFEGQGIYFYLNHPIKWVRLVGVIVAVDIYPTRWIAVLDDGSGRTVEVVCGRSPAVQGSGGKEGVVGGVTVLGEKNGVGEHARGGTTATGRTIDLAGVDVGTVVKVKGGVGTFRGEKQLALERLSLVHSTTEEAVAWAELSAFKDILNKPWVLSEKEQARAKRKAEGWDRKREHKAREERKREKQKVKEEAKRSHKEKRKRDQIVGREIMERKGTKYEARMDGERRQLLNGKPVGRVDVPTVAKSKVIRPVVSGNFDALGL